MSSVESLTLKILVLGDSNVGKTSLLLTYTDNYFPESHVATIGVEYKIKTIQIKDYTVNLQIWDTSGQERFRSITKNFLRGADGIVFVYDITSKKSFNAIKGWMADAESNSEGFEQVIAGNKSDLKSRKEVEKEAADRLAAKKGIKNFETSAKLDENVDVLFRTLAEQIIGDKTQEELIEKYTERGSKKNKIKRDGSSISSNNKKKGCC